MEFRVKEKDFHTQILQWVQVGHLNVHVDQVTFVWAVLYVTTLLTIDSGPFLPVNFHQHFANVTTT